MGFTNLPYWKSVITNNGFYVASIYGKSWKLADWTHNDVRFSNGHQTFGQMFENWKNI
jgi:hypothetical protein